MHQESRHADLAHDVLAAIEDGGRHAFGPDDPDQRKVIGVRVDRIEEPVAELRGVHEREEEGGGTDHRGPHNAGVFLRPVGIVDHCDEGVDHGEG